ncbi:hypothetical protein ZIOFF_042316 [Zingiber officinale]|uniref:Retrovirus-related Pol polyprotein from transposon TNT 1-94 n=1 Tax=Zingiber officinale TaxID=94328 RepID=A0A8J5GIX6_ZINOF|nr:hypothetical protein ZIOFF_042316 [Zingiber officinale]
MMSDNFVQPAIPRFDGHYDHWSMLMKIFLRSKEYWQVVESGVAEPAAGEVLTRLKLIRNPEGRKIDNTIYKQIIGSLMYLTATRPDIMHAVSLISRYMESPKEIHLQAAKRIFRYLKGTIEYGLFYKKNEKSDLIGFTDSDYAGDLDDRKSTSGYIFMISSAAISWCSKKQPIVTLSTTEAEFVATTVCASQAIWLKNILEELYFKQEDLTKDGVIDLYFCTSED